jgi:hypothetical protein
MRQPRQRSRSHIAARLIPLLLVAASLGPYVHGDLGIRTEQIAIYGLVVFSAIRGLRAEQVPPLLRGILVSWSLIVVVAVYSETTNGSPWTPTTLGALDNWVLPLALMLALPWIASLCPAVLLLRNFCWYWACAMALNGAWALLSSQMNMTAINSRFWSVDAYASGVSVGHYAESMGRHAGVFNQPLEAGIAYSLAVICLAYVAGTNSHRPGWQVWGLLLPLTIGGLLSTSKVFILFGLPLGTLYLILRLRSRPKAEWVLLVVAIPSALALAYFGPWMSIAAQGRLAYISEVAVRDGLLAGLTANRFGSSTAVVQAPMEELMNSSPYIGLGLTGAHGPLDNSYYAVLVAAGMFGLLLYFVCLLHLARGIQSTHVLGFRHERDFMAFLTLLILLGGMGGPVLTLNRVGSLLWCFLILLLIIASEPKVRMAVQPLPLRPRIWSG